MHRLVSKAFFRQKKQSCVHPCPTQLLLLTFLASSSERKPWLINKPRSDWPVEMSMENYLGGLHWCRKAQPNVGSTIHWSAGPAMYRKLAKREPLSHLHSFCFRILPWVPALTSLSDGFFTWKYKPNKFFFPWVAFGHDICCNNRGVTRTFLKGDHTFYLKA